MTSPLTSPKMPNGSFGGGGNASPLNLSTASGHSGLTSPTPGSRTGDRSRSGYPNLPSTGSAQRATTLPPSFTVFDAGLSGSGQRRRRSPSPSSNGSFHQNDYSRHVANVRRNLGDSLAPATSTTPTPTVTRPTPYGATRNSAGTPQPGNTSGGGSLVTLPLALSSNTGSGGTPSRGLPPLGDSSPTRRSGTLARPGRTHAR